MIVKMMQSKKVLKSKKIKAQLAKELNFLKNIFSVTSLPLQLKGESEDSMEYEIVNETGKLDKNDTDDTDVPQRARSIAELEQKLQKIKSQNNFNLKNKLVKKSLSSKLNKKIKKRERMNKKSKVKMTTEESFEKKPQEQKPNVNVAKPVFNTEGKLVFSKFDFANIGQKDKVQKVEKDPKKVLENLKHQEEKLKQIEQQQDHSKVKEIKEKIAWKNALQKAEGQKIKDDPILLKKSIKKMEQKKKHSKKQWDNRIKNIEQKKDERQKKRSENIAKKKKEKKSKIVKAAVKRGRVVI